MSELAERPLAAVTGASSGIGLALARQFAQHGYDLVLVADDPAITAAAAQLRDGGTSVRAAQLDLTSYDAVEQFYDLITDEGRPLDALAVNAGVGVGGAFVDNDLADELRLIELNVASAVHLAYRALADMARQGHGRVLFTSSIAATMPGPYFATYAASKAFLHSFAAALRAELEDSGVHVTALLPGPTDTPFFERAGMQDTKVATGPKDDPDDVAREAYEALMAGEDQVVAGSFRNRLQTTAARVLPEKVKAHLHGRQTEPGSGD